MDAVTIEITKSKNPVRAQRFRWRVRHQNGQLIATSGEFFYNEADARRVARKLVAGSYALIGPGL